VEGVRISTTQMTLPEGDWTDGGCWGEGIQLKGQNLSKGSADWTRKKMMVEVKIQVNVISEKLK